MVVKKMAHIVASWTGVPVQELTETESVKLLNMENTPPDLLDKMKLLKLFLEL